MNAEMQSIQDRPMPVPPWIGWARQHPRDASLLLLTSHALLFLLCGSLRQSQHVETAAATLLLAVAMATDLTTHRIHNWLTYSTAAWAIVMLLLVDAAALPVRLAAALVIGGVMLLPYQHSRGGAGDVKLAISLALLLGFHVTLQAICVTYITAAVWMIGRRLYRGRFDRVVPLAGFFAFGVAVVMLRGPLW